MDNEQKLDSLTNQPIVLSLGGKSYTARQANLNDVGRLNKFIKEMKEKGDDANLDLDSSLYILWELIKDYHQEFTDWRMLGDFLPPFDGVLQLAEALKQVGFKVPQSLQTETKVSKPE